MNKTKIIFGLLIIVVAGASFFAGMKYRESQRWRLKISSLIPRQE